jgi:hypothetical protein
VPSRPEITRAVTLLDAVDAFVPPVLAALVP